MRLLKSLTVLLLTVIVTIPFAGDNANAAKDRRIISKIDKSVVKVMVTYRRPSFYQPWQYKTARARIGSGFVIDGGRIITNAHIVSNAVFIEVKRSNDPKKYVAKLSAVGHQCDLAVLVVEDRSFYKDSIALSFGPLPQLSDTVSAYGFPQGGSEISITQGVVSRIEQVKYSHSGVDLLAAQIDAAINPGNSGGPVVRDGAVVGVAMQSLRSGDNIGYIIPTPIVKRFLNDLGDGKFDGFPHDGLWVQKLDSPTLKESYRLTNGESGVLVTRVTYNSSFYGKIKPGDVITHIAGEQVADDGTILTSDGLRLQANYLTQKHLIGAQMKVTILRDNKSQEISANLKGEMALVPLLFDDNPTYMIYGGFVFTPLTANFLREWGRDWYNEAPLHLRNYAQFGYPSKDRQQIVLLNTVLAHDINAGYHNMSSQVVKSVNGTKISAIGDMAGAIASGKSDYVRIVLENGNVIVVSRTAATESEKTILRRFAIPSPVSPDLKDQYSSAFR